VTTSRKLVFWEVDAQADFMLPGGKLYVPGAEKTIPNLKRLVDTAGKNHVFLVSSACAHSENDPEFKTFPPHCIRGTPGARIVPEGLQADFRVIPNDPSFHLPGDLSRLAQVVIEKQVLDVFSNPHASELVERLGLDAEYVVFGVVTEYCVQFAAKGLLERGRKVTVVTDAIETLKPEEGRSTLERLAALGARLATTDQVLAWLGNGASATLP
jgi:nicotinamidase/pyrazinamidase